MFCTFSLFHTPFAQGRQNGSPFSLGKIDQPNGQSGTPVPTIIVSRFASAKFKHCNNPFASLRSAPPSARGRLGSAPHFRSAKVKGGYGIRPHKSYSRCVATFHACRAGISQKHRFYFTLPMATFHRAIGATPPQVAYRSPEG